MKRYDIKFKDLPDSFNLRSKFYKFKKLKEYYER